MKPLNVTDDRQPSPQAAEAREMVAAALGIPTQCPRCQSEHITPHPAYIFCESCRMATTLPATARVEPPTQEQGSVRYWLAEAVRDLNRARGEITTPAEDRLIDVCGALIAALAAHRAPPTQEPTSVTIKSYTSTAEAPPLQMCTCSVITDGHRVPTSAGCPVHGRG